MKWERHFSAGVVLFRKETGTIYYLLLKQASLGKTRRFFWAFPKGTIEQGESAEDAAKREVQEETGLIGVTFLTGFKETERYIFQQEGKRILKIVTYFVAETSEKEARISFEHADYAWLPYEEALAKLSHKGQKEILRKANEFLLKQKR